MDAHGGALDARQSDGKKRGAASASQGALCAPSAALKARRRGEAPSKDICAERMPESIAAQASGHSIFLCPLGGLSSARRRLLERRIREVFGECLIRSDGSDLARATHCVVDSKLPSERFYRQSYGLPSLCKIVCDTWLMSSLDARAWIPENGFEAWRSDTAATCKTVASIDLDSSDADCLRARTQCSGRTDAVTRRSIHPDVRQAEAQLVQQISTETLLDGQRDAVGLDCEFVGVGKNTAGIGGDRNALARVSIVASGGRTLLDTTVRVSEPVVDFRIHITGLTQEALDGGVSFEEARAWVEHFVTGRIVVGHALSHDWKVLGMQPPPPEFIRDTARNPALRPPGALQKTPSLADLATAWLGESIQLGVHDSVEDASTALKLYMLHKSKWDEAACVGGALPSGHILERMPPAPRPPGEPPVGARALVRSTVAAAAISQHALQSQNTYLAAEFERRAARPGAARHSALHYRRVARTLAALPYAVEIEKDLERPELACLGKPGCFTRSLAARLLRLRRVTPDGVTSGYDTP